MLDIPSLSAEIDSDIYAMEYARCTAGEWVEMYAASRVAVSAALAGTAKVAVIRRTG
jgi:hypothetical protein